MKKLFVLVATLFFGLALFACGEREEKKEPITLDYLAHNLGTAEDNNIERRMIAAFEEKYDHITVNVIERTKVPNPNDPDGEPIDQDWIEFLTARATAGTFPDVFTWFISPAEAAAKGWAYDLKDVVKDDADFKAVPQGLREAGQYGTNKAQYALVTSQYNYGYLVNQSLIEEHLGATSKLTYGVTYENFLKLGKDIYDAAAANQVEAFGFSGVSNEWYNWLPSMFDNTLGYNAFNDGFKYNSAGFKSAMTEIVRLQAEPYVKKFSWEGESAFKDNKLAAHYINSADIKTYYELTKKEDSPLYNQKLDFIGLPTKNGKSLVPSIIDLICVGKSTEHPKEAYELAKWMTFGIDGYSKRVEISKAEGFGLTFAPILDKADNSLSKAYLETYSGMTEFSKFLSNHNDFIPEGGKIVPGYWSARQPVYGKIPSRENDANVGDLWWDTAEGKISNWVDFCKQAEDLCAAALATVKADIDAQIAANN